MGTGLFRPHSRSYLPQCLGVFFSPSETRTVSRHHRTNNHKNAKQCAKRLAFDRISAYLIEADFRTVVCAITEHSHKTRIFIMPKPQVPFPFSTLVGLTNGYVPSEETIDPEGAWDQSWAVFSIGFGPKRAGSLRMQRKSGTGDTTALKIDYRKDLPNEHTHQVLAEITCRDDLLSSPVRWTVQTVSLNPSGGVVDGTNMNFEGSNEKRRIVLTDPSGSRRLPVSGDRTISWNLLDAVQRLPRNAFESANFTLLDNFDQIKPNHTLSFREDLDLPVDAGTVHLRGYDHLGWGIVPVTYWVDDSDRLLFVVAGIEAYVPESCARNRKARS